MIRRLGFSVLMGVMCLGWPANAADLPSYQQPKKQKSHVLHPKVKVKAQKVAPQITALKPVKTTKVKTVTAVRKIVDVPDRKHVDLAWVLDPLVANADGSKNEGSASVEGNLIVTEPGSFTSPSMIIELSGHIVKTAGSTARLDIRIAGKNHQFTWKANDVESGAFVIQLNGTLEGNLLPAYVPVSALAFATKTTKSGVAMVSLEKVTIRLGRTQVSQQQ